KIENLTIMLGNKRLMEENAVKLDEELESKANSLIIEGKTTIFMSIDKKLVAIFALADTIKDESLNAIEELHKLGIKVVMLTGDNTQTAEAIAKQLKIDEVIAEVLPGDKAAVVKYLQFHNNIHEYNNNEYKIDAKTMSSILDRIS